MCSSDLSLDRILTTDNLQKRPILAIVCAEQKVWGIYGPWFLVCLVFIGLCRIRLLRCSIAGRVSCPLEVLCHIVCVGVFDRNENARCFEDCERSILHIKSIFFLTLLEWSLVLPVISCISLPVLIDYCNLDS